MEDRTAKEYRDEKESRAFAWFVFAAVMLLPGLLLMCAGLFTEPPDDTTWGPGAMFVVIGVLGLATGLRLRYLRSRRPNPMQILRGQILRHVGAAIAALVVGGGGAAGAVAFSPWVDREFDPMAFAGMLLLALMFIPLAWVLGMHKTRHLRRIRRLAVAPRGERHRVVGIQAVDDQQWVLFKPASEVVGVPLIHGQDLTHLTDDDGLAEADRRWVMCVLPTHTKRARRSTVSVFTRSRAGLTMRR